MLVSEELADKMYSKSGFLYKNFTFLFQNAFWHKPVPGGFTICPFFWLSLLAVLFRVLINAPVEYAVKPAYKVLKSGLKFLFTLLGKVTCGGANKVDRFLDNILQKFGSDETPVGLPTTMFFGGVALLYLVSKLSVIVFAFLSALIATGLPGFIIPIVAVPLLVVGLIVSAVIKTKSHKCCDNHFMYPLMFLVILSAVTAFFVPATFGLIASSIWLLISSFCGFIAFIVMGFLGGIWWVIETIGMAFMLAWPTIQGWLPSIGMIGGGIIAMAGGGYLLEKHTRGLVLGPKVLRPDPNIPQPWWRSSWVNFMVPLAESTLNEKCIARRFEISKDDKGTLRYLKRIVTLDYLERKWGEKFDFLAGCRPCLSSKNYDQGTYRKYLNNSGVYDALTEANDKIGGKVYNILNRIDDDAFDDNGVFEETIKACKLKFEKDEIAIAKAARFEARIAYIENLAKQAEVICAKVCAPGRVIRKKANILGQWLKLGWNIAVKSKKEVCPWKPFTD